MENKFMRVEEVAAELGVSASYAYKVIRSVRISADMKIYKNGEVIASASAEMMGLNSAGSDQKTKTGSFSFPIMVNTASLDSSCELVIIVYGDQYEYHYMYGYQKAD